ncbi:STAS domain-containing protein [Actinomadura parmotrematis]|uniref:Anti-sigma factor antagonist n=1 Tax=Actinomadura parmotrematis TaxID=2864039 RepID=A0ABS7FN25_9ACTN|nr:STAS domain-containing protein [Actinomadura parmotrematis]MBW8481789.1 STAS domain-containing protein [Actinomadura parmotrematis]
MITLLDDTPPADAMGLRQRVDGRWVIVTVTGDLDLSTAPRLEAVLDVPELPGGRRHVAVDAAGLEFCDSTGVNVLIRAWKRLKALQGQLILLHVPEPIRERIGWMGLDKVFSLRDSLPEHTIKIRGPEWERTGPSIPEDA